MRVVDAARAEPLHADLTPRPGRARWFCGVLSAGLDAAVNAHANALTWPRGSAKYVRAVASELARFHPYGYRITADTPDDVTHPFVWTSPGTVVAVANGHRFGGGVQIAPDARVDDGLLDLVTAGTLTRLGAARIFPGMYQGKHVHHPAVDVRRATSVLIETTDAGRPPPPAFADGERISHLPVRVTVAPGALHVLDARVTEPPPT
ncbi:hypothetical protein DLJ96_02890 [Actinotalea fermentans ATCC 43279 = JCM 9966 = DSM 3133]|nr:hypothetical protein DLJ96_02890 [Actinotalea fermentans ATCC 43279 = JCM 9966 = DSM 3133]